MSETDTSVGSNPSALELPKYYPLHRKLALELPSLTVNSSYKLLNDLETELLKTYEKYIDVNLELNKEDLTRAKEDLQNDVLYNDSLKILQDIHDSKINNDKITTLINKTKLDMNHRYRNEEELNIETLRQYQSVMDPPLEIYDLLIENSRSRAAGDTPKKQEMAMKDFQDKIAIYIDPYAVIKSQRDENDEDELEISGGRIDLRCPISQALMKDPVITQCKHTFDKSSLDQHRRESHSNKCPVCGGNIGSPRPDEMMLFRLRANERDLRLKER